MGRKGIPALCNFGSPWMRGGKGHAILRWPACAAVMKDEAIQDCIKEVTLVLRVALYELATRWKVSVSLSKSRILVW